LSKLKSSNHARLAPSNTGRKFISYHSLVYSVAMDFLQKCSKFKEQKQFYKKRLSHAYFTHSQNTISYQTKTLDIRYQFYKKTRWRCTYNFTLKVHIKISEKIMCCGTKKKRKSSDQFHGSPVENLYGKINQFLSNSEKLLTTQLVFYNKKNLTTSHTFLILG